MIPRRLKCLSVLLLAFIALAIYFSLGIPQVATSIILNNEVNKSVNALSTATTHPTTTTATPLVVCNDAVLITILQTRTVTVTATPGVSVDAQPTTQTKWVNPMRHAAKYEEFQSLLNTQQKLLVQDTAKNYWNKESARTKRIEKLYNLKSSEEWLDFIMDHDEDGMPPLTKFAQDYLWKHQNPSDCSNKKFLVMTKFPNDASFGMGAIIQAISINLNIALRTGYILLYNTSEAPGEHFIETPKDPSHPCKRSLDCIFQKISHCGKEHLTEENTIELPTTKRIPDEFVDTPFWTVPPVFGESLRSIHPDISVDAMKYWWRSQSIAYLMRPNKDTMSRIKELRLSKTLHKGLNGHNKQNASLPFPMPRGSFNMHVRHGDKFTEMRLIPFKDYVRKAERFVAENPLAYQKMAFISSEDADVIHEAISLTHNAGAADDGDYVEQTTWNKKWTWYWSDIPRMNTGPETQLAAFGNRTDTTITHLLQLLIAIECDGMVGTRGSGWNRVLDSLRCIWLANCKQPFLEVGDDIDWSFYAG